METNDQRMRRIVKQLATDRLNELGWEFKKVTLGYELLDEKGELIKTFGGYATLHLYLEEQRMSGESDAR
ncbi:hypothetical protein KFD70_22015 [Bacillus pfraonensis]